MRVVFRKKVSLFMSGRLVTWWFQLGACELGFPWNIDDICVVDRWLEILKISALGEGYELEVALWAIDVQVGIGTVDTGELT